MLLIETILGVVRLPPYGSALGTLKSLLFPFCLILSTQVLLGVIRLPQHGSDLVVSLNTPVFISERSAAAEHAGSGLKNAHLAALPLFRDVLASLKIIDYGLFGGSAAAS